MMRRISARLGNLMGNEFMGWTAFISSVKFIVQSLEINLIDSTNIFKPRWISFAYVVVF